MMTPMNAKAANDKLESLMDDPMYSAEIKYDGARYLCNKGNFISRIGKDKTANVPHLSFLSELNVILDGEVYYPNGSSNDTTSIMGSLPKRALELQQSNGFIRYVIFDILELNGIPLITKELQDRQEILKQFYKDNLNTPYVDLSISYENKKGLLDLVEAKGYEGVMLKNKCSLYYPGKRPEHVWYKVKKHMTDDVVIMGFTEGAGKFLGNIGSIVFGKYVNGKLEEFGRCSGMTDELREDISRSPDEYIGRVMEISAMEGTAKGKYRHPQFGRMRDDKLPEMCQG